MKEKKFIKELEPALVKMLKDFNIDILTHYDFVEAYLKDVSGNEISGYEIKAFIVFITALNTKNVSLSSNNKTCLYFMKVLEKALQKTRLYYEPLYDHSKWG